MSSGDLHDHDHEGYDDDDDSDNDEEDIASEPWFNRSPINELFSLNQFQNSFQFGSRRLEAPCGSQWAAYNWVGCSEQIQENYVNNFHFSHVIDRSKPRWWKVARAVFVKWCIWEIPRTRRVLSRNPIKVEHMKTYSNLTMPNSSPNDEWREHFQTRGLAALTLLRQIWINLFFICRITGTNHSKSTDFDDNKIWKEPVLKLCF